MQQITFFQVVPDVFADKELEVSEVWQVPDLCLERGRCYLIEAASGTGKSSFCHYIYGQRQDYQGVICFEGQNIRNLSATQWDELRRDSLSMLFQDLRLFPELTALENIQLKNNLSGTVRKHSGVYRGPEWISNSLGLLGIEEKANVLVGKLSFGQQQRVALIRALCQPFDFIFLDEPVSHLDDANGRCIAAFLAGELEKTGAGMVVTSIGKHPDMKYDKTLKL